VSGPDVKLFLVPVGGMARLEMPGYLNPTNDVTTVSISRAVSGPLGPGPWTTVYSGPLVSAYVDAGDSLPGPLDPFTSYVWQVTDATGTTEVGPLTPASTVVTQPDYLTNLMVRSLQACVNNMVFPPGFLPPNGGIPAQVTVKMPQQGWQAMPFIVVNLELIQQTEVGIGEDVVNPNQDNQWTLWSNAKRVYRVSIFSQDAEERDFYRDSLLILFRVLKATVFAPIGQNVSHSYQAVSGTDAKEWEGHTPGFYYADLMLELDGVFSATVTTNYLPILGIDVVLDAHSYGGSESVQVPMQIPPSP
jgi:hypothetical protein